jgi:hypothetical protein
MMLDQYGEIAKRAYTIWEVEGRPTGRELDHWLRAETEVQGSGAAPADLGAGPVEAPLKLVKPRRPARKRARRTD